MLSDRVAALDNKGERPPAEVSFGRDSGLVMNSGPATAPVGFSEGLCEDLAEDSENLYGVWDDQDSASLCPLSD